MRNTSRHLIVPYDTSSAPAVGHIVLDKIREKSGCSAIILILASFDLIRRTAEFQLIIRG